MKAMLIVVTLCLAKVYAFELMSFKWIDKEFSKEWIPAKPMAILLVRYSSNEMRSSNETDLIDREVKSKIEEPALSIFRFEQVSCIYYVDTKIVTQVKFYCYIDTKTNLLKAESVNVWCKKVLLSQDSTDKVFEEKTCLWGTYSTECGEERLGLGATCKRVPYDNKCTHCRKDIVYNRYKLRNITWDVWRNGAWYWPQVDYK